MKLKLVCLAAVALLVAALPAVQGGMASVVGAAVAAVSHSNSPDTVPCYFDHPESLPEEAADMASTALDARSTHCPPTLP